MLVTCGICGMIYEEAEGHEHTPKSSILVLPQKIRDTIWVWAERKLRGSSSDLSPRELEEVDVAKWVIMYMWLHQDYKGQETSEELFEQYEKDILTRYPKLRGMVSRFRG